MDCAGGQRSVRDRLAVRVGDGAPTRPFMVMSEGGVAGEVETHEVDLTMQRGAEHRGRSEPAPPAGPAPRAVAAALKEASGADRARPGVRHRLVIVGWVRGRPDVAAHAPSR